MEGASEAEKNHLKRSPDAHQSVQFEDLDGSGVTQTSEVVLNPATQNLDPEKSKTVFMNLINVDEKAQVPFPSDNCFCTYHCNFRLQPLETTMKT